MPDFFVTPVSAMSLVEVRQLYDQRIPENIRLEYKGAIPATDADFKYEMAKALSSFANTFGGYFVVGISTDAQGNPVGMNGVEAIPGYAHKVTSVGYNEVYPPVVPVVSPPVELGNGNVCYVVYQDLSLESPHFLTKRRGAFVRVAEFTQTFTPQLATWEDLRFLANRREVAFQRREKFYGRSRTRMGRIFPEEVWQGNPTTLMMWIGPAFPSRPLSSLAALRDIVERSRVTARGLSYPRGSDFSLADTLAFIAHEVVPEYLESNIYAISFSGEPLRNEGQMDLIHGSWILSRLILRIRYGMRFLLSSGYDGLVNVRALLFRIRGKRFVWRLGQPDIVNAVNQEEEVVADVEDSLTGLEAAVGHVALRLFRTLAFACGWKNVFEVADDELLAAALETLMVRADFLRMP